MHQRQIERSSAPSGWFRLNDLIGSLAFTTHLSVHVDKVTEAQNTVGER